MDNEGYKLFLENERMKSALEAILMNTLHRDFGGDYVYKVNTLGSIRVALGEEKYNHIVELYS